MVFVALFRTLLPFLSLSTSSSLSTAYSAFCNQASRKVDDQEIDESTDLLLSSIVPSFAAELDSMQRKERHQFLLLSAMHQRGINFRFMGYLRAHSRDVHFRSILLLEMIARTIKVFTRKLLRWTKRKLLDPGVQTYKAVIVNILNLALGAMPSAVAAAVAPSMMTLPPLNVSLSSSLSSSSSANAIALHQSNELTTTPVISPKISTDSTITPTPNKQQSISQAFLTSSMSITAMPTDAKQFWQEIKKLLIQKYPLALTTEELDSNHLLLEHGFRSDTNARAVIFHKLKKMLGLRFNTSQEHRFLHDATAFDVKEPFGKAFVCVCVCVFFSSLLSSVVLTTDIIDLMEIVECVKQINIVALAQGYVLKTKLASKPHDYEFIIDSAIARLQEALQSMPDNKLVLVNLADLCKNKGDHKQANQFYLAALDRDPEDVNTLAKYASFLQTGKQLDLAEKYYSKAIKVRTRI
jgi:hypothetical protein